MGFLSPAEWLTNQYKVEDPSNPDAAKNPIQALPVNSFQAQAAQEGTGPTQLSEQDFSQIINNALMNQQGVNANQNALGASLQAQANGTGGPNLAQQQLQNATNQNIQSQAGAVGSIRGLSPALAQRLVAMNSAEIQQKAAGQSAEQRMQQQLAAQQQLAGLYGQQASQNAGFASAGIGGQTAQNSLNLQNFANQQAINANTAGQNASLKSAAQGQNLGLAGYNAQATGATAQGLGTLFASGASKAAPAAAAGSGAAGVSAAGDYEAAADTAAAVASKGGMVPGNTPYPDGDSRTDTKPYMLAPGEVIVPAKIADDPVASAAFLAAMKRRRKKKGEARS